MTKPFEAPKHTQFSNDAIDYIMREVSPNAWKIITVAIRKTYGWHKHSDVISLSQFQELTGIASRSTLVSAIKEVLEKKILTRKKNGKSFEYQLNREYVVQKSNRYSFCTDNSTETVPVASTETVHTKESIKETTKDKDIKDSAKTRTKKAKDYPPVMVVRNVMGRYPARDTWDIVCEAFGKVEKRLGREPTADDLLPFWKFWRGKGWNPQNLDWLTELAVSGNIPQNGKKSQSSTNRNSILSEVIYG